MCPSKQKLAALVALVAIAVIVLKRR